LTATPVQLVPTAFSAVVKQSDGNYAFSATGNLGQTYSLLTTTNLGLAVSNWTVLSNGTITSSPFSLEDLAATNSGQRFYLLRSP
jgi:hypothetical protein